MNFHILTLFPRLFDSYLEASMLGRARERELVTYNVVNLAEYSVRNTRRVDDRPYGGLPGTILMAEPIAQAVETIEKNLSQKPLKYVMTPRGTTWTQSLAQDIAQRSPGDIILLCGHYEGIDQRVIDTCDFQEVSVGDYVLTSGVLPALLIVDCITRLLPGVITQDSSLEESFSEILGGKREYPQYTRPEVWRDFSVPKELLSGNPKVINVWKSSHLL